MSEWNSSTSYAPGVEVTYLGLAYRRSQFPPAKPRIDFTKSRVS